MLKANTTCFDTRVRIKESGEEGTVTGYCQHKRVKQKQFMVEYKAGDGRFVDAWFFEDQLQVID